jgi:predicted DNA-binding protein (UPF0251 family)
MARGGYLRAYRKRRGLMAIRRLNQGRIKMHRSYSIEEASRTLGVHKNTVANWLKNGLDQIDAQRPILIQGRVLRAFLHERRKSQKSRCAVGELHCLKCRGPRLPLDRKAVYPVYARLSRKLAKAERCFPKLSSTSLRKGRGRARRLCPSFVICPSVQQSRARRRPQCRDSARCSRS